MHRRRACGAPGGFRCMSNRLPPPSPPLPLHPPLLPSPLLPPSFSFPLPSALPLSTPPPPPPRPGALTSEVGAPLYQKLLKEIHGNHHLESGCPPHPPQPPPTLNENNHHLLIVDSHKGLHGPGRLPGWGGGSLWVGQDSLERPNLDVVENVVMRYDDDKEEGMAHAHGVDHHQSKRCRFCSFSRRPSINICSHWSLKWCLVFRLLLLRLEPLSLQKKWADGGTAASNKS